MPMDTEIARSFLDWTTDEVTKWLSTLGLSQDYSQHFKNHQITGEILIKLNPAALDQLKITEGADRVKILQQITTMRADLIIESPGRRVRSPSKFRRFSETVSRSSHSPNHRLQRSKYSTGAIDTRTLSPVKRGRTPISPKYPSDGLTQHSPDSLSFESPGSSRMSSPIKLRSRDVSPHDNLGLERREGELVSRLSATATFKSHTVRRRSRSLDGLFQDGEDIFSISTRTEFQEACNSRLVDILREENSALKKDLETYYQRVRKLQKLEQEIEHIREGQRMLEASSNRREKLEAALRAKMEKQVRNLRGEIIHLKAELHRTKKQEGKEDIKNGEATDTSKSREIRKRDTMIMRLIKRNQETVAAREQLEKDLHLTRLQLQEQTGNRYNGTRGGSTSDTNAERINSETESKMSQMYSQSIEKLKSVLSTMQSMSQKREKLEQHLREQLLTEIQRLKGGSGGGGSNGRNESYSELLVKVASLEADLIKWEQRCLELVAEKQMVLEAAVIPRDSRMEQLERTLSEQTVTIQELYQQRGSYIAQLTDASQKLAELETKVSSLKMTLNEKDVVIQALQHSFLDPDELSQDDYTLMGSPVLHHSPVAAKQFPMNGTQVDIDGTVSLPGDLTSNTSYTMYSGSPPQRKRVLPNGTHPSPMGLSDGQFPVRRYSDKTTYVGTRSLSPVKRSGGPPPVYMMKDPPAYGNGGSSDYGSPSPHFNKLSYPFPVSNSAPNSPNNRTGARKSRISHPNIHFLQVPASQSPSPTSPQKFPFETGKSNTSPVEMRRNHSIPSQSPTERGAKSKTPPPNYKLVSFSSTNSSNRGTSMPKLTSKQRHHSMDNVIKSNSVIPSQNPDSMELFDSLLGEHIPPHPQQDYKLMDGVRDRAGVRQCHQHSKSSPSAEIKRQHCYT